VEGSGHSLIDGSIRKFAWGVRKTTKHPSEQLVSQPRCEPEYTIHVLLLELTCSLMALMFPLFNRVYSTDGEESQRAPSDRTMSEYMISNERAATTAVSPDERNHRKDRHTNGGSHYDNEGSDIYVTSAAYKAPSELR
jgi:hypothetical protein